MAKYTIGLDYGTNSVRALVVDISNGAEAGSAVHIYSHGKEGVILSSDPNLARQHPADYLEGAEITIKAALAASAKKIKGFKPSQVIGIGVDTTGSTPLPVDKDGTALALTKKFAKHPAAMAWLWKDHTGVDEASQITTLASKMRPQYLAKCGGIYSSEWFFSKVWHCLRTSPEVFDAAYTWVEMADWIPAMLTGTQKPGVTKVCVCAAGHKAMFNAEWGGYPDVKFLSKLHPKLGALRGRLATKAYDVSEAAGNLTAESQSPSGPLMPISAGSARESAKALWSKRSAPVPVTSWSHRATGSSPIFPASAGL
jgi:L-ribulokinase